MVLRGVFGLRIVILCFLIRHGKGDKRNTKFSPRLVFAETTEIEVDEKKRHSNTIMGRLTDESVMKFCDMSEILEAGTLMSALTVP